MDLPTTENLRRVRVVVYDGNAFLGVPYEMREGQQPLDVIERYRHGHNGAPAWVWLGSPGWYGTMSFEQRTMAQTIVERCGRVAWYKGCWTTLPETTSH